MKITITEVEYDPLCPHCKTELTEIHKRSKGFFETHVVYICPHCHAVLSIGNDRWT